MKKWSFLFAALLIGLTMTMSSCGDDGEETDPGPSLNLKGGAEYTSQDAIIEINSDIKVGVLGGKSSVSGNKLTNFKLIYTSNNIPTTLKNITLNADSFDWDTTLSFPSVGTGRLSFELTDKGGMKNEKGFNITVQGKPVQKYLNVELGSYNDALGSFFSSSTGGTFNVSTVIGDASIQAKVDFLFFKGTGNQNNQNTFASPDDADAHLISDFQWTGWDITPNQTRFNPTSITAAQFDAIGDNYDFPVFNTNVQTTKMSETYELIHEGSVFLFKTQAGKLGLVKVIDFHSRGDLATFSVIVED